GVYLFLSGHNQPGGGFIGGLVLATAFVLMFLTFDSETVNKAIPFDFKKISALGVLLAFSSSALPMFFGQPFMSQTFGYFDLPIFGKTELATVILFESGVALTVIGVVVNIITSISDDE